jgi:thiol-disulfide isomerase/thioredoxin
VDFRSTVANVEYSVSSLESQSPQELRKGVRASGELWYGKILRRLEGDGPRHPGHPVLFMAEYALGYASRAWCDANFNGDLSDDPPLKLSSYPPVGGARSFLVDLRWTARDDSQEYPIEWKLRVVLEPATGDQSVPTARVQRVFAMVGRVDLEGDSHRAFLFDGNGDGLYRKDFFDGLFVDLNNDLRFEVDPMSPEFAPLAAPFQMGRGIYEVASVDPEGKGVVLRRLAGAEAMAPLRVGQPAPDFSFRDTEGRDINLRDYRGRYVLVNFWASWCGSAETQAAGLREIYEAFHERGLEIIGISYDTDRAGMESFRREHQQSWPTSFSGKMFWEDPVGRLYQARYPGALYLLDREGRLDGIHDDTREVVSRLAKLR